MPTHSKSTGRKSPKSRSQTTSGKPARRSTGEIKKSPKVLSKQARKSKLLDSIPVPEIENEDNRHVPLPTKHNDSRLRDKRTAQARRRLGITSVRMRGIFPISRFLAQSGGINRIIDALRLSDDDLAIQFLDKFDSIPASDQVRLNIEEIAVAAEVDTRSLLGLCVAQLVEAGKLEGQVIAADFQPRVIRASAELALHPLFEKDRENFLRGTGFLPTPKGSSSVFVRNEITNQNQQATGVNTGDQSGQAPGEMFTSAEKELKSLHESIDGARLLEAPRTVIDASAVTIGHQYKQDQNEAEAIECIPNNAS